MISIKNSYFAGGTAIFQIPVMGLNIIPADIQKDNMIARRGLKPRPQVFLYIYIWHSKIQWSSRRLTVVVKVLQGVVFVSQSPVTHSFSSMDDPLDPTGLY